MVRVADSGPGVAPALRETVFAEGWTTKEAPVHRPRGLGLALVRRLVERTGGRITVGDGPLGGAQFTVELPEALHTEPDGSRGAAVGRFAAQVAQ